MLEETSKSFIDMSPDERKRVMNALDRRFAESRENIKNFLRKYPAGTEVHRLMWGGGIDTLMYDHGFTVDKKGVYDKKNPTEYVEVENVNETGESQVWEIGQVLGRGRKTEVTNVKGTRTGIKGFAARILNRVRK